MLRVYNRFLDLLTETSRFQSLQYPIDFHGVGQFELHINENLHGAEHMQKDNVIALSSHKAGIIRTIENTLGEDGKASETIKVSGYTTDGIMSKRATIPPKDKSHDTINDDAETVMKHYAEKHFLNPDDPGRKMPNFMIAPNKGRGKKIKWESRFKNVAEELEEISKETGLGWCVYLDFRTKKYIFDVVESKDLTQSNSQGNNPVFFSPDFGTIKSQTFIDSDNDLRNFAYIGGQGEGVDRKIVTIGEAKGWNRIETFIDARDVSDEYDRDDDEYDEDADDNKRPEEEIEQDLIDRGNKKMEDMQRLLSFEAEILTPVTRKSYEYESDGYIYHAQPRRRAVVKNTTITPFEYEVDFNIGDIVDVFNKKWGVSLSTPIVEILEIHEQGGFRIEATFGETRPTITKKLKRKFDDIEDIDKQEKYYEYVDKKIDKVEKKTTADYKP